MQGPFPSFANSSSWYPIKVLKSGTDSHKPMSYTVHHTAISAALSSIGLESQAKTHVGRRGGARMAELGGASDAHIRRAGHWTKETMEAFYLTLRREVLRSNSGFCVEGGAYFLKRATIDPPASLTQQIFPDIELWLGRLTDGNRAEPNIAAGGFLQFLRHLRVTILQDSVELRIHFPDHPTWNHPVFRSKEYRVYAAQLRASIEEGQEPTNITLQRAIPIISEQLTALHETLKTIHNVQREETRRVDLNVMAIRRSLTEVLSGRPPMPVNRGSLLNSNENDITLATERNSSGLISHMSRSFESSDNSIPPNQQNQHHQHHLQRQREVNSAPSHKMSRGLQRVQDVWQEWETGLSFGPAIKILEETWGPAWCHGYERRFFNWRKLIIDAVEARMISHSIDANRAASWLDNVRRRKRWSLNNLSKNLGAIKNLSAVNHV